MAKSPRLALGLVALAALALGADEPKQTIDAKGLTFDAPKAWESTRPTERFRRAYLKVSPAQGDKDPGELVVTSLFGDGGGVEANVARWEGMFQGDAGGSAKAEVTEKKGQNVDVTVVDVSGHYVAAVRPGRPQKYDKPNYRLLGAIVQGKQGYYFLKLTGPAATLEAAKPAFDELVESIKIDEP